MRLRTFLIAAAFVGVFVFLTSRHNSPVRTLFTDGAPVWTGPSVAYSAGLSSDENNNIEIYKAAKESVVYITSTTYQRDFFFGVQAVQGLGSGFLINADGQILTNFHVISGSSDVEVTMPPDQSRYKAKILHRDPAHDLALIQIEPKKKLTAFLKLGDSDGLQVGQKVLAIGNPFGLAGTLTTGIVSSLHRKIQSEERGERDLEDMIQTDAAINSGNSGGPLLDSQGYVIGINTAIYGPNGGSVGIGFAIPINRAKVMLGDFKSGKLPASSAIGVTTYLMQGDLAEALRLPTTGGLLVARVGRGTPASAAGLRGATQQARLGNYLVPIGGDLITAVDGKKVEEENAIAKAVLQKHAGDTLDLTIWRDGRSMNVKVTLAAQGDGVL